MDILICAIVIIVGVMSLCVAFSLGRACAPWGRYLSAGLFVLGAFVWCIVSLASLLFHNGILPDDIREEGLAAVLSYLRAVTPGLITAYLIILVGIGFRIFHRPNGSSVA